MLDHPQIFSCVSQFGCLITKMFMYEDQSQHSTSEVFFNWGFMTLVKVKQGFHDAEKIEEHSPKLCSIQRFKSFSACANASCSQKCSNSSGSAVCLCNDGFELNTDGATCIAVNECKRGTDTCNRTTTTCKKEPLENDYT